SPESHPPSPHSALSTQHSGLSTRLGIHFAISPPQMRHRNRLDRRCTYLVVLDGDCGGDLREFAAYLSELGVAKREVVILDGSSEHTFARHRRVLCWVGRHVAARPRHRNLAGAIDPLRVAVDLASCDKVIVAQPAMRYDSKAIDELCSRLDTHELVEPQDY